MTWMEVATWMVRGLGLYAVLGLIFGAAFVSWGIGRVDSGARGSGWGFRLIVLPGSVALWPLLLSRWMRGGPPRVEANAHRRAAERR